MKHKQEPGRDKQEPGKDELAERVHEVAESTHFDWPVDDTTPEADDDGRERALKLAVVGTIMRGTR